MERHGRRGRGLQQHEWRVRWEPDAAHANLLRDRRTQRDAMFRAQNCNQQDAGDRETVDGLGAFPRFPTDDAADEATRRIRVVTSYMRVTRKSREGARRAEKRRKSLLRAARDERERLAAAQRAREAEERREAARQERGSRTVGPAARTRPGSTVPADVEVPRPERRERLRAPRRGPTHVCARVGAVAVAFVEFRRPPRGRFGDG